MLEVRAPKEAVMAQNWEAESCGYLSHGNHIARLMDNALERGYELQVRSKKAKNQEIVEEIQLCVE